uniref:Elongation factor EFG domain-containing protein n=1 Tax=Romanomermis culicivorax TaxID=13658 RepID=A0A915L7S1_ROMCU
MNDQCALLYHRHWKSLTTFANGLTNPSRKFSSCVFVVVYGRGKNCDINFNLEQEKILACGKNLCHLRAVQTKGPRPLKLTKRACPVCMSARSFITGKWMMIEPVMKVEVSCPLKYHQEVLSLLSRRQALVTDSKVIDNFYVIESEAPLNDMFGFVSDLRRSTQGQGEYSMEFVRYTPVRLDIAENLIKRHRIDQGLEVDDKKKKKKN